MTPQEQQMIDGLISRVRNTPVESKDTEAEQHIQQSLNGYPDALYVLVQTVLVQQYGLGQAQSQLNELKQQNGVLQDKLDQAAQQAKSSGGSFLSHIFGSGSTTPANTSQGQYQPVQNPGYGSQAAPPPPPPYPPQGYPQTYPAQGYPQQGGGLFGGGGGGGFLQGALQTAAGVAAGEMVFQGMEDLFHGFGHGGGYGRGFGAPGGSETIINNYGDDDRGNGRDDGFYNPDRDASRTDSADIGQAGNEIGNFGGDAMNFGSSDSGSDDLSVDNGTDSSSFDSGMDNSSFDDGGSGDFGSDNS